MKALNKTVLAVVVGGLFSASVAHAVVSTNPTPALVGHKPTLNDLTKGVTGELKLGKTLTASVMAMDFTDLEQDVEDLAAVRYVWEIPGHPVQDVTGPAGASFTIPTDAAVAGQPITLKIYPATVTGDPKDGEEHLIADLSIAGATGGGAGGTIEPNTTAAPIVSNLILAGKMQAGENLTATYTYDHNGSNSADASVHTWTGTTTSRPLGNAVAAADGVVAPLTLTPAAVGEVVEIKVLATNVLGTPGNTITVDTAGNGVGVDGGADNTTNKGPGDSVTYQPAADVASVLITIANAAADEALHGAGSTGRPVVDVSTLTAELTQVSVNTDPGIGNYTFKWMAGGVEIETLDGAVAGNTYVVPAKHPVSGDVLQGEEITVDVVVKP